MSDPRRRPGPGLPEAVLFARLLLALLFLMPGWAKVFGIGPLEVAREMFVGITRTPGSPSGCSGPWGPPCPS